ncbi:MAG TPA: tetratricopeptide repeat protein [Bacteroidota bacterium]|nr:tetratricopeptide repeat protein [Bacteroidota bacterium]
MKQNLRSLYTAGFIFCLMLLFSGMNSLHAQAPDTLFFQANDLYRAGNFQDAAKNYDSILQQGFVNADVYYNLGDSYYRCGKLAPAIIAFERAARLRPHDADIEHNLRLLYLKTPDRIEPVPDLFLIQWMRTVASLVAPVVVRGFFLASWMVLFGILAGIALVRSVELVRAMRIALLIVFISVVLWGAMLGIQSLQDTSSDQAIITAQVVTAKSSPDARSVDAFVIHEGLKVKLTDAVGDWVKITLADGKVGWLLAEQCEKI